MFAFFAGLTAGAPIDSRQQACAIGDWVRGGLARLGRAGAVTAACLCVCARRVLRRLRHAWITVRWRFSVHRAAGFPPAAGNPGEPKWRS